MAGKLSNLVDYLQDKKDKQNLLELHLKVTELCEKIPGKEFDENDDFYFLTNEKIMHTGQVIKEFKENHIKLFNVFYHINNIIKDVIKIMDIGNEE
jgi:hypothetical protein